VITARAYRQGVEGSTPVDTDAIATARGGPGTLLLIDVGPPAPQELDGLSRALPLHPLTVDDLRTANQRTKLDRYADHFHVAVHPARLPGQGVAVFETDLVFGQDWLLVVRQRGTQGEDPPDLSAELERFERARIEPGADDLGCALWAILDVIVDGYFEVSDHIDDHLDAIEEIVFGDERRDETPQDLFLLRRGLVRFRRSAVPLREVLGELVRHEVEWLGDDSLTRLQDVYDHTLRVADLIDSQRDLLTGLLDAHLAIVSNRMNDVMKKTSSWGALILVPSLIAGIYGMNFRHMLLQEKNWGYPAVMVLMVAVTASLYLFFRRRKWL
jgi:magnesium transporter